jgi:hypothetical protein
MGFYLVKSFNVVYIIIIQFLVAILINIALDKTILYYDVPTDNTDKLHILIEFVKLIIVLGCLGIFSYIGRVFIRHIPSPFDGIYGLKHLKMKELLEAGSLTMFVFLTSDSIDNRVKRFRFAVDKYI